jgi:hypothetical protein
MVITSVVMIPSIAVGIAVPRRASETDERAVVTQRAALWSRVTRVHHSQRVDPALGAATAQLCLVP